MSGEKRTDAERNLLAEFEALDREHARKSKIAWMIVWAVVIIGVAILGIAA